MPTFAYTALKGDGKRVTGELDAGDRGAAMDLLDRGGLPVSYTHLRAHET